jgi:hypothetical protein
MSEELTVVLTKLATVETKVDMLLSAEIDKKGRLDKHSDKISELEREVERQKTITKVGGVVLTTLAALAPWLHSIFFGATKQ